MDTAEKAATKILKRIVELIDGYEVLITNLGPDAGGYQMALNDLSRLFEDETEDGKEDFAAIIRRVRKPDLPKLPWEGPFEVYAGEIYDKTGSRILYGLPFKKATALCALFNAAWGTQKGE